MKIKKKQTNSHDCLVCGLDNEAGVKARFYEMEDDSTIVGLFTVNSLLQSYPGRTHGGIISAIIDETVGRAIWIKEPDTWGVTMKLEVEFHKPVPYDVPLKCVGSITKSTGMIFEGKGEIIDGEGRLLARGTARYIKLSLEKIAAQGGHNDVHPEEVNVYEEDNLKEIDINVRG